MGGLGVLGVDGFLRRFDSPQLRLRKNWLFAGKKEGDDRNRTGVDGFAARRFQVICVICRGFQFCEML